MILSNRKEEFINCVFTVTENSCRRLKSCSSITESRAIDNRSFGTLNEIVSFAFKSINGSDEFSVN